MQCICLCTPPQIAGNAVAKVHKYLFLLTSKFDKGHVLKSILICKKTPKADGGILENVLYMIKRQIL